MYSHVKKTEYTKIKLNEMYLEKEKKQILHANQQRILALVDKSEDPQEANTN